MDDERDVAIEEGAAGAAPEGDELAGPGTVRQGSGYSGSSSAGVATGTGHDPSPYDPPTEGYMGGTTSSDLPEETIIEISPERGA